MTRTKDSSNHLFIEDCFHDKNKWELLERITANQYSPEYTMFYAKYQDFIKRPTPVVFKELYEKFIAEGKPHTVNLPASVTEPLKEIYLMMDDEWDNERALDALHKAVVDVNRTLSFNYRPALDTEYARQFDMVSEELPEDLERALTILDKIIHHYSRKTSTSDINIVESANMNTQTIKAFNPAEKPIDILENIISDLKQTSEWYGKKSNSYLANGIRKLEKIELHMQDTYRPTM